MFSKTLIVGCVVFLHAVVVYYLTEKMDWHARSKTESNERLTLNDTPWISRAIRNSIKIRNKIDKQYCKKKDQARKELLYERFKTCRNNIVVLTRISKEDYDSK